MLEIIINSVAQLADSSVVECCCFWHFLRCSPSVLLILFYLFYERCCFDTLW